MTEKTAQKEPDKKPVPSKKPKPQQEVVVQIPLSELHPFPDHPFQVREDVRRAEKAQARPLRRPPICQIQAKCRQDREKHTYFLRRTACAL